MFLIPTYLAPSPIHGTGVFSAVPVKKGTVIWRYDASTDWMIKPEELDQFPEPYKSRMQMYSYLDESGVYVLCGDNAKFMNHSEEPNCDDVDSCTIARRDIEANEELTCNYRAFDVELKKRPGALYASDGLVELKKTG